ncbi:YueI family protein [Paucilactobacillus hokkaidonensis]|uniref:YueI family protein n=1 Tax=Paucilactobacillus hokkaidonensis TaxID=1193095 RepID=UPI0006D148E8|nr:YueI family protein [Paucilactobacillus hokkaidonensis]
MPDKNSVPTDQHLQNAIYGTPKINPDEQRKYLGTFRERVGLTINVDQLQQADWTKAFEQELTKSQSEIIFFNGNIDQSQLKPYILAATNAGINFTIKTNPDYHVDGQNLAVVVAAKKKQFTLIRLMLLKKYGTPTSDGTTPPQKNLSGKKNI